MYCYDFPFTRPVKNVYVETHIDLDHNRGVVEIQFYCNDVLVNSYPFKFQKVLERFDGHHFSSKTGDFEKNKKHMATGISAIHADGGGVYRFPVMIDPLLGDWRARGKINFLLRVFVNKKVNFLEFKYNYSYGGQFVNRMYSFGFGRQSNKYPRTAAAFMLEYFPEDDKMKDDLALLTLHYIDRLKYNPEYKKYKTDYLPLPNAIVLNLLRFCEPQVIFTCKQFYYLAHHYNFNLWGYGSGKQFWIVYGIQNDECLFTDCLFFWCIKAVFSGGFRIIDNKAYPLTGK